ncbi:(2Fe-2S) ferredoxin domain-containing protein [Sphingomonas sp. RS6]
MTRLVASNWGNAVLVCGKCSKKIGGGFGEKGKTSLAKGLRKRFGLGKGRKAKIGVIETKCLGVCPGGAVTVVNGARSREWLIVKKGADLDEVGRELGLS